MYTAVVLTDESKNLLLQKFSALIPDDWEKKAHHFTIHMGRLSDSPAKDFRIESLVNMNIVSFAKDGLVMAVGLNSIIPSSNKIKHITLAVNREKGGKPFFSNKLEKWIPIEEVIESEPICIYGTLLEID